MNWDYSIIFEIAPECCISDSFVDYAGYSISSKGFLSTVVDTTFIWLNSPLLVHFNSMIPKLSMFALVISYLTTSILPWFIDLSFQVPMQYRSLQHRTLLSPPDTSTTGCCFCFGSVYSFLMKLFIHSSPSNILGTYQPEEFIFQCPSFLPFHTVCGVLKARILKWFAIPFSNGPCFVRLLHHDPSILGWSNAVWLIVSLS